MKIWTRDSACTTHSLLKSQTFITWIIDSSLFDVIGTVGSASKCLGTTSTDRHVRSSALPLTVSSPLTATTPTPCATSSRDSSSAQPSLLPNLWLFWLIPPLCAAYSKGSKVKCYPQALSSLKPTLFDLSILWDSNLFYNKALCSGITTSYYLLPNFMKRLENIPAPTKLSTHSIDGFVDSFEGFKDFLVSPKPFLPPNPYCPYSWQGM